MINFPRQFLIAGTDTGVGKTVVAAILTRGLKARYWKPVQSGREEKTDTELVKAMTGLPEGHFLAEAYCLQTPISPHASARRDGITIDRRSLALPPVAGPLIVEGAGGLLVPLNDQTLLLDVMRDWGLPVLLVARSRLGTINHTLLSLMALKAAGLEVLGVVMNGAQEPESRQAIEKHGQVGVLAELAPLATLTPETISAAYRRLFGGEKD